MLERVTEVPLSLYPPPRPGGAGQSVPALAAVCVPRTRSTGIPYLHAWIVTRYEDVITVLTRVFRRSHSIARVL